MDSYQPEISAHFKKSLPVVRAAYEAILDVARTLGPVREDPKKTTIHLVRETAFAGVAARRDALILTLKSTRPINNPRVHRAHQTSTNRWHMEIRVNGAGEVDNELKAWIADAYELA
jgi:hypothetical protein